MKSAVTGQKISHTTTNEFAVNTGRKKDGAGIAVSTTEETVAEVPADVAGLRDEIARLQAQLRQNQAGETPRQSPPVARTAMGVMLPNHQITVNSFGDFSDADRRNIRDRAVSMERAGRLFIQRTEGGGLERAKAFDVFNSLEYGVGGLVYVVDSYTDHSKGQSSASSSTFDKEGWRSNWHARSSSSSDSGTTSSDYGSSPLLNWNSFKDWATESGQGLPGVGYLPAPEGNVSTGFWNRFQSQRSSVSHEYHFFRPDEHRSEYDSSSYWDN